MLTLHTLGLDLGAGTAAVAHASYVLRRSGGVDPEPLSSPRGLLLGGQPVMPTAIHAGDGILEEPAFGAEAEARAATAPERFYPAFPLYLGRPDLGQDAYMLAKSFFNHLRQRVAEQLPLGAPTASDIWETRVGHPVLWPAEQREGLLLAAQEAGLPNVRLMENPLAALYAQVFAARNTLQLRPGSRVLSLTMGAGATDFAFFETPAAPDQRAAFTPVHPTPDGGRSYGGRDVDLLLYSHMARRWDGTAAEADTRAVLLQVRAFKEAFSTALGDGTFEHEGLLQLPGGPRRERLARQDFEKLAATYIRYFEALVRSALEDAGLRPEEIGYLVLSGGHSRWYFVQRTLGRVFPHLFVGSRTFLRHSADPADVARGLAAAPLASAGAAGFLEPRRRAAHPVWLQVGLGAPAAPRTPGDARTQVLLVPRGQLLPARAVHALPFTAEQLAAERDPTLTVEFLTGALRIPLAPRTAGFEPGFWQQVAAALAPAGRRIVGRPDTCDLSLHVTVDEHELLSADLVVSLLGGRQNVEIHRQTLHISPAAPPPDWRT